jgi:hypothetical protein
MPQPPRKPRTDVDAVFVDVIQMFARRKIVLSKSGIVAARRVFDRTLGRFLSTLGRRNPNRDIWNEDDFRALPKFVHGVTARIARKSLAIRENPVDGKTLVAVSQTVMTDPTVHASCERIIQFIEQKLGRIAYGICSRRDTM